MLPLGSSEFWLGWSGYMGREHYGTIFGIATPPPKTPSWNPHWRTFEVNYEHFGHSGITGFHWVHDDDYGDCAYGPTVEAIVQSAQFDNVGITWNPRPSDDVANYKVYRATNAESPDVADFECIATLDPTENTYLDNNVTVPKSDEEKKLLYYVTIVDDMDEEHEYWSLAIPWIPLAPQNLQATAPEPDYHPVLTWNANSESEVVGYNIYKKLDLNGVPVMPYTKQNDNPITDTTWTDTTFTAFHGGPETAYYQVTAVNEINGESQPSNEVSGEGRTPQGGDELKLDLKDGFVGFEISPNPFNNRSTLRFGIPSAGQVNVSIFNVTGQKVAVLFNRQAEADKVYKVTFDGTHLATGLYICRFSTRDKTEIHKLMLLK
jgi:hypothetical protein